MRVPRSAEGSASRRSRSSFARRTAIPVEMRLSPAPGTERVENEPRKIVGASPQKMASPCSTPAGTAAPPTCQARAMTVATSGMA